jgi:hypothetical protein
MLMLLVLAIPGDMSTQDLNRTKDNFAKATERDSRSH